MNKNTELHKLWQASQNEDAEVFEAMQKQYNVRKQKALRQHKKELLRKEEEAKAKPKRKTRKKKNEE